MRFAIGLGAGLVCSALAGVFAWRGGIPEDSGALVELAPVLILGWFAIGLAFGAVVAAGVRRVLPGAMVVAVCAVIGLVFSSIQANALRRSCELGTGPQPAFCYEPSDSLSHPARLTLVGITLGLICVSLAVSLPRAGTRYGRTEGGRDDPRPAAS